MVAEVERLRQEENKVYYIIYNRIKKKYPDWSPSKIRWTTNELVKEYHKRGDNT